MNLNFHIIDETGSPFLINGARVLASRIIIDYILSPSFRIGTSVEKYDLACKIDKNLVLDVTDNELQLLRDLIAAKNLLPAVVINCLQKYLNTI